MLRPVAILDSISVEAIVITLRPVNAADGLADLGIVPLLAGGPRAPKLDVDVDGVPLAGSCEDGAPATVLLTDISPSPGEGVEDVPTGVIDEVAPMRELPPAPCCQRAKRGRRSMLLAMEARSERVGRSLSQTAM